MHRLLKRQLDRLRVPIENGRISIDALDQKTLDQLLMTIEQTYNDDEESYNLLQNSLKVSSAEMRALYEQLQVKSRKRLEAVIAASPDLLFLLDKNGVYLDCYTTGKEYLLYKSIAKITNQSIFEIFEPELALKFHILITEALTTETLQRLEYKLLIGDEQKYFEARVIPSGIFVDGHNTVITLVRDITRSKEHEYLSHLSNIVFEEATEGIMISDSDRRVMRVNPAMIHILGIPEKDLLGKHSDFFSALITADVKTSIDTGMIQQGHWHGEIEIKHSQKESTLAWLTMDAVKNDLGEISNFVSMLTDISEIRYSRDKMTYLATHDVLTGLPNRTLLFDRLEHAIASSYRTQEMGALCFFDIDHFKKINDTYGHEIGDSILREFANRLTSSMRASDTVGRLSGDEFLLIISGAQNIESITRIAQKLITLFEAPIILECYNIKISISIGIALFPHDGSSPEALIRAADDAMYRAKQSGRNNFQFYSDELSSLSKEHIMIREQLEKAILENSFTLLYQPHYSLEDDSLRGIEVFLRCTATKMRNIPISRAIAVAEESQLINAIGIFVLNECSKQLEYWQSITKQPIRLVINLSPYELIGTQLTQNIKESLVMHQIEPSMIEFDITEKTLALKNKVIKKNVDELFALGCQFCIDDFGVGDTSFGDITDYHFHKLKIDPSLIRHLPENPKDQAIVSAIISMAKKLGLTVLAEGVESEEQANLLRELECDEAQGYLFNKPLTADEITQIILENKSREK